MGTQLVVRGLDLASRPGLSIWPVVQPLNSINLTSHHYHFIPQQLFPTQAKS